MRSEVDNNRFTENINMTYCKSFILCFFLVLVSQLQAQQFKIDTLQYHGSDQNMVNFVVLGDGYTENELPYLREDAGHFMNYFFQTEPFAQYRNLFNVFLINTISSESGAVHECSADDCPHEQHGYTNLPERFNKFRKFTEVPESHPNTIFGSAFDNYGIHRLVIARNSDKIREVLRTHIPNYTQTIILVNSPYYGGSGGEFPTTTVNIASNDIAVHEIGHSFANLGDEYWAGNMYAVERANRSQHADPETVPWKHWLGINGVGIYTYGAKDSRAQWFRPHEFCKMQYLVAPFCSVCQEVIVQNIHEKTNPIIKTSPQANDSVIAVEDADKFVVNLAKPIPNSFQVTWYLNDQRIAVNADSIYLNPGIFKMGNNDLRVVVTDTTSLVRNPQHRKNTYFVRWTIHAPREYELTMPLSTWGDTIEGCYDGFQALSIKKPQAGLIYKWYDSAHFSQPIAITHNLVTPRLKANQTYYVESAWKDKVSARRAIHVKILGELNAPENITVRRDLQNGFVELKVLKPKEGYNYIWTKADGSPIYNWNRNSNHYDWREQTKGKLLILAKDLPSQVFVHAQDAVTTCVSRKIEVKL